MAYFLDLFSPETYETFKKSKMETSGFRIRHLNAANRINIGDKLICYMTKLSRWIGVLEVTSQAFQDDTPIFYEDNDPFIVRFKVKPIVLLAKEKAIPIHEDEIWNILSFTRNCDKNSRTWTGKIRTSLVELSKEDGEFLEQKLAEQQHNGKIYEVDEEQYKYLLRKTVRRLDKTVPVSVPKDEVEIENKDTDEIVFELRESYQIQAIIAKIGSSMGMRIWIPARDRKAVLEYWKEENPPIIDKLPLNYDETTLKTIEQIDVIWLRGRSIKRAFEVEHTTAIYSGILRMADLLALQPNMDIKLHIIAPDSRREKVFQEMTRPVFSLLEKGPLSEICTFISYESIRELIQEKHLTHLSDTVLEEFTEEAD